MRYCLLLILRRQLSSLLQSLTWCHRERAVFGVRGRRQQCIKSYSVNWKSYMLM